MNLRDVLQLVARNRWLVLGVWILSVGGAALYTYQQAPTFESSATLRIDGGDGGRSLLGDLSPLAGQTRGRLETDMFVMRSRAIAEDVVDSLHLAVTVLTPRRPRGELLHVVSLPETDELQGVYVLRRQRGGYSLTPQPALPVGLAHDARVTPGVPFRLGSAVLKLDGALAAAGPDEVRFAIRPRLAAVAELRTVLRVHQPDPHASVVGIGYRSTDPVLAAAVPNAVAAAFIHHRSMASRADASGSVEFLAGQVALHAQELTAAEEALRQFREEQRAVNLTEEASHQVRRLAELQAERDQLVSERNALAGLLARVSGGSEPAREDLSYRQLASFPVFLSNRAVQDILSALTQIENERARLLVTRTPTNEDVQGLNGRIRELESQLHDMAQNYLEGLDSKIASLEGNLARFGADLTEIPAREVAFARLQRQQVLFDQLYTLLQTRLKEAEIREALVPSDIRLIDTALVPQRPVAPRPLRTVLLAGVLGLAGGLGLVFLRHSLDTKVRTREDAQVAAAGIPILGVIPHASTFARSAGVSGRNGRFRFGRTPVATPHLAGDRLFFRMDPQSPVAEAYRALRTSITYASVDRKPQALVVTSSMPGEGKTTTAANLAITVAQQGTRTLLVDADLRRGVLHSLFDVAQEPGLTQLLVGRCTLEEAVVPVGSAEAEAGIYLLPTGTLPPNPAELLGSRQMRELIVMLRERFEIVIFDAPPLNLVTDAAVLGTMADSTILVARTGTTDKGALRHAMEHVQQVGAPVGGVVLNDVSRNASGGYGYGYGSHAEHSFSMPLLTRQR